MKLNNSDTLQTVKMVRSVTQLLQIINLDGHQTSFEIDTGAGDSFLSKSCWIKIDRLALQTTDKVYTSASVHKLPVLGVYKAKSVAVMHNNESSLDGKQIDFVVTDIPQLNLLGRNAIATPSISLDDMIHEKQSTTPQQWRIELASLSYTIKYRSGKQNTGPDTFSRAFCSSIASQSPFEELHNNLCHPGISRLLHFVRAKNLLFSTTDVKRVVNFRLICAEIKPQFHRGINNTLIKATQPMERLSIDFKGPLPSSSNNKYLFIVVDEYSRFPFAFPCKEMTPSVVINCLDKLFSVYLVWHAVFCAFG